MANETVHEVREIEEDKINRMTENGATEAAIIGKDGAIWDTTEGLKIEDAKNIAEKMKTSFGNDNEFELFGNKWCLLRHS